MNRVVHFEISADDPERAAQFYRSVFSWNIQRWDGPVDYWLAHTGEGIGIDGAIKKRPMPEVSTTNTIEVSSVDEAVEKVKRSGGKMLMPKTPIPGIGYHAYCMDTEGNIFGLMENDPLAK
jgi:predicted enzyme related to lactoylglutathione lyase